MHTIIFGDRVAVKLVEAQRKIGSIYLADQSVERPQEGTVIAVGEGVPIAARASLKEGAHVLFTKFAGSRAILPFNDEDPIEVLLVHREDLEAAIEGAPATPSENLQ